MVIVHLEGGVGRYTVPHVSQVDAHYGPVHLDLLSSKLTKLLSAACNNMPSSPPYRKQRPVTITGGRRTHSSIQHTKEAKGFGENVGQTVSVTTGSGLTPYIRTQMTFQFNLLPGPSPQDDSMATSW